MLTVANPKAAACIELARAIAATGTSDDVYGLALTALEDALEVSRAAVLIADADGVQRVKASRGLSVAAREALGEYAASALHGLASTADGPASTAAHSALRVDEVAHVALYPLVTAGREIGTLVLCFDKAREFAPDEVRFADVIASQVAFAVERWRTEQALEVSSRASQHLAAIVESSGDAIVSKSLDGTITSWNRAAERMFGYTAAEVLGQSITIIIPADRLQEERTVLAEVRAGHAIEMETIRRRKDGSPIPIGLTVSPIRDGRGRIVGASKVARDISVRVRVEAERADLHRRLKMLVGASASLLNSPEPDAVLTTTIATAERLLDADGFAVWVSTPGDGWRAIRHAGVSDAFATRRIAAGGIPAAAASPFAETRAVTDVQTDPLLAAHWPAYKAEGIRSMLVCPMSIPEDGAGTLVFYFRSPRSFADADVETGQALANLAGAALRTAALHDRLRRECVAADEASRVKDEFLATLSHELRTPLNAILGYAQLLDKGAFDHERSIRAVSVLRRNAESLRQIIDDVLDIARITSGKLRLSVESIDFAEVVRDGMATLQPGAAAKDIALDLHVAPDLPRLWGDGDRLRQVVWNLLSNAVKFTQPGGHVRVALDRDGSALRLVVSDDGQGIEPAFLPHIFERFRQGDARFSREHGGLGLGLAIVRDLVELHGGTVTAESAGAGQGATFTVRLPPGSGQARP